MPIMVGYLHIGFLKFSKVYYGEISVFNTCFGLMKFGRLGLGSKRYFRTKDSGCSCNQGI